MRQHYLPIPFAVFVLLLLACNSSTILPTDKLTDKCAPYDQFAFQRSFPDTVFDWQGWQKSLQAIRMKEGAQARSVDCGGNVGNWTEQGPANVGARCNTLAVKPDDENTVLAGFAGGGIFKTTDGGVNWKPVFDQHLELCIGHIVFDPSHPNVVYAGTGDPNLPALVFNGDGVFKSTDAGETWTYIGLSEQGIISKVVVHPAEPKTLLVAAMGNPYVRDEHRGIYKSKDGGQSWQRVLFVSTQAGASDLVRSPADPNVLYACFWDRIRNNKESIIYGPNAKVFKSEDGGDTWVQMGGGLPTGVMGRTGLAISKTNPDKAYVVYIDSLSTPGGLFKTVDGGDTWTSLNIAALESSCSDFGWYFGKIRLNPNDDEDVYFLAITMHRKLAGTNSWMSAGGGHADSHDLVYTPSGRRYWSNDGGVYRNDPGQQIWTKCKNLPVTQFYHTDFNPHQPNVYWGGTQDNGIQKGQGGANINSWASVFSADGFNCAFHPTDPLSFWVQIQNGTIHRTTNGGSSWEFGSAALGTADRVNWDAPFFLSKFNAEKLFSATYRVYFSSGSGWGPISPDLTDGIIYSPRFHTVSALQESPILADKLMAGTSDGNVWRREPTSNWINITGSLPDRYVTSVQMSPTLSQRLYVTHSGFRDDEYIPHVHRSDNNGAQWVDISGDLPQIPVNDLLVLPGHADSVLFVATDAGVYFTKNYGGNWHRLGANMPYVPVFDLEENPVRKELVAATFARGIWTFPFDSVFVQQPTVLVNVSGKVATELGAGINDVAFGTEKSTLNGTYHLTGVPGCGLFSLTPYRNDNPLNGLTTYDLVLISKHILGIEPLGSPYKMIAADANRSNSVSTSDIVAFRKLILGIDDTLAGNTSWRFLPKSHSFTDLANPFLDALSGSIHSQLDAVPLANQDFTGIKVGDVNDSAVPNATGPLDERVAGSIPLMVQDIDFQSSDKIAAVFSIAVQDLAAIQFSLKFDVSTLSLEGIEPLAENVSMEHFGTKKTDQGLITVALEPATTQGNGTVALFKIIFRTKKGGNLRQALALANWPTPALAFGQDGTAWRPTLWKEAGSLFRFSPNPFGETGTWLDVQLPGSGEHALANPLLEIFDRQGKVIHATRVMGTSKIHLGAEIFGQPGVYFWRLRGSGQSGKLVYFP